MRSRAARGSGKRIAEANTPSHLNQRSREQLQRENERLLRDNEELRRTITERDQQLADAGKQIDPRLAPLAAVAVRLKHEKE